ncbi:MAG: hypothetical protein LBE79_11600 [Tannerella sp.]|jgi:hypothetical protein|nr:hypothetical protein [Tannerella sp.]
MQKRITIQEAGVLLEKYYEGLTSAKEEKQLHTFLSQKQLPQQFVADKAILNYFDAQKKKSNIPIIPLLRWTSVAASLIIGIIAVNYLVSAKSDSFAYIDGKRIIDKLQIMEQASASIQSWNNSDSNAHTTMDELIDKQLQLFAE